jgi:hypothetical protein
MAPHHWKPSAAFQLKRKIPAAADPSKNLVRSYTPQRLLVLYPPFPQLQYEPMKAPWPILALFALICPGCASYQFDILQPPAPNPQIHDDQWTIVRIDPLEYRLRAGDGRLVMRIFNPTNDPIQLLGDHCAVVDPDGQSHPLQFQMIAPQSFILEVFPPLHNYEYGPPPQIQIGVGAVIGSANSPGYIPPPGYGTARVVIYPNLDYYWDWQGESDVRMTLSYSRGNSIFAHFLLFHRARR